MAIQDLRIRDTGYVGELTSLAGVRSAQGMGLTVVNRIFTTETDANIVTCIEANPRRVWASVQNTGAAPMTVVWGSVGAFANIAVLLQWDILTIDADHPWTGAVSISTGSVLNAYCTEVSLAGV